MVFCTEFRVGDRTYAGHIIATSWDCAGQIAFGRGLDEQVIGVLTESWPL